MTTDSAALRQLLDAATPGPWTPGQAGAHFATTEQERADAALIVAAVNALPALLDERDRLREALRDTVIALESFPGGDMLTSNARAALAQSEEARP